MGCRGVGVPQESWQPGPVPALPRARQPGAQGQPWAPVSSLGTATGWALKGWRGLETRPAVHHWGGGWWLWGLQWAPRVWARCAKQGHSGPWCCTCFCGLSTKKVPSTCYKCIRRLPAFIDTLHFAFLLIMWQTYICLLKTVHVTLWMW